MPDSFKITLSDTDSVTGILYRADKRNRVSATLLLGHGAGSGQTSGFMVQFASGFANRGIDTATFNFLYTERGRGAPDRADKLEACCHAAIRTVREIKGITGNRLVIGGKSMGGRIASQVAAAGVDGLAGLVYLGYPLHPPGRPEQLRSKHLDRITAPMLFVQGSRDSFGTAEELRKIIAELNLPATLYEVETGDHSFKILKKSSSLSQEQVYETVMDEIVSWIERLPSGV